MSKQASGIGNVLAVALLMLVAFLMGVGAGLTDTSETRPLEVQRDALTTALAQSNQRAVALQDSVLAGTIEGFGLRCYLVREGR